MSPGFSDRLETIPPSGIRAFFELVIGAEDIISLGVGEPDFPTPWSIREKAISAIEKGNTSYTSNAGLKECRQAISKYLEKRFHAPYNADTEIILTSGVSEGVDIALRAILNPGDEVIVPEPGYVCYPPLIQLCGATSVSVETHQTHLIPDPQKIAEKITSKTKAIVICSPNNPTGAVIPASVLEEIAKLAIKHDLWVLSDEIYAEISYVPYTSMASIKGMKDHTILLSGFSKAFAMTGWRLGYLCGPEEVVKRALKIHQYSALCAPIIAQIAAIEALRSPEKEIEKMKESYQRRRDLYVDGMNEIGLFTQIPEGAFYAFTNISSTGLTSQEFALKLLREKKVAVIPGAAFGASGEGFIRACYATEESELKEAIVRIRELVLDLKR
jgi:aminotransferase